MGIISIANHDAHKIYIYIYIKASVEEILTTTKICKHDCAYLNLQPFNRGGKTLCVKILQVPNPSESKRCALGLSKQKIVYSMSFLVNDIKSNFI